MMDGYTEGRGRKQSRRAFVFTHDGSRADERYSPQLTSVEGK